jgi:hypothetical protein
MEKYNPDFVLQVQQENQVMIIIMAYYKSTKADKTEPVADEEFIKGLPVIEL